MTLGEERGTLNDDTQESPHSDSSSSLHGLSSLHHHAQSAKGEGYLSGHAVGALALWVR